MEHFDPVALVVGGGRGIGRATALALARQGANLAVTARTPAEIEQVAAEIQGLGRHAEAVRCDVSDEQSVNAMIRRVLDLYHRIDILVFCAGIIDFGHLSSVETEMWDRVMGVNLRGAFLTVRAVLPTMRQQQKGNVVLVSAIGAFGGGGIAPIYRASKAGLNNIAEAFAMETLGQGIRVNTVCPAETDTEMCRTAYPPDADASKWMKPEDIADVILFLASDQSRAMTGATLIAAGYTKLSRWG